MMIDQWVAEVKKNSDFQELGMILVHNGVVRATSPIADVLITRRCISILFV